jgi:hypothetical protein
VLHYERVMMFYEWIAGLTLGPRLVLAVLLAIPAAWLLITGDATGYLLAILAGGVLLPLAFGAARN